MLDGLGDRLDAVTGEHGKVVGREARVAEEEARREAVPAGYAAVLNTSPPRYEIPPTFE